MTDQSKELTVFDTEKQAASNIFVRRQRSKIRIAERDAHASGFIENEEGGFIGIKAELDIRIQNSQIKKTNLVTNSSKEARELFAKLNTSADQYFNFANDFFEFYHSDDRTFEDLFRRPFTLGDLEEHKSEEQFPDDIEPRALLKALVIVIERNQWKHIFQKRVMQLSFSFVSFLLLLLWLTIAPGVDRLVGSGLFALIGGADTAGAVSLVLFAMYIVGTYALMSLLIKKLLKDYTIIFRQVNRASCRQVIAKMSLVNNWLREAFFKLVGSDVEDTQDNFDVIKRSDWSETAAGVFRLSLWFGRRIYNLEQFGQIQFEKLRIFEMLSERVGNFASRALAVACAALSFGPFYLAAQSSNAFGFVQFSVAFAGYVVIAWRFGAITRRSKYSFGMGEIAREQFNENWRGYSELGYYGKITALYKGAKDAIRTEVISKHPGAAARG